MGKPNNNPFAWAVVALAFLLSALSAVIHFYNLSAGPLPDNARLSLLNLVMALTFPPVGLLILRAQPEHPIGRIFLGIGGLRALSQFFMVYSFAALEVAPGRLPLGEAAYWLREYLFYPGFLLLILLLAIFPDGRSLTRRWNWIVHALAVSMALYTLSMIVEPFTDPMPFDYLPPPVDPIGPGDVIFNLSFYLFIVALAGGVASLFARLKRSRGLERQQLKWFVFAGGVFGLFFLIMAVISIWPVWDPAVLGQPAYTLAEAVSDVLFPLSIALIPLATGAAITRYRLYGIDLIIRRTLIYSTLTLLFGALYVAEVFAFQALFFWLTKQERSEISIVLSTLALAALFAPTRTWVQNLIDRRFYRARYDAEQALTAYLADLRNEVDLHQIVARTEQVVDETLQPRETVLLLVSRKQV